MLNYGYADEAVVFDDADFGATDGGRLSRFLDSAASKLN